jgi:hypothetical protein
MEGGVVVRTLQLKKPRLAGAFGHHVGMLNRR